MITRNIYFTDAKMSHIGVCSHDGSACTVLHNKDIDKPRSIALQSNDGQVFTVIVLCCVTDINIIYILAASLLSCQIEV